MSLMPPSSIPSIRCLQFGRIASIPADVRDRCVIVLLGEFHALCMQDPSFRAKIVAARIVPCPSPSPPPGAAAGGPGDGGVRLYAAAEVYDPLVPELVALLDLHLFPVDGPFRAPHVVSALRSLGMRSTMTRQAVCPRIHRTDLTGAVAIVVLSSLLLLCCCYCCCLRFFLLVSISCC